VRVLDKEPALGAHASGRNSGVLHAGFYYSDDSLKMALCREGNARWQALCSDRQLPLRRCGKLVVARDEAEVATVEALAQRGQRNGVEVRLVSAEEARGIEPRVRTHRVALWSPRTATVDPAACLRALAEEAAGLGVSLSLGERVLGRAEGGLRTESGVVRAEAVVNAAGLHADRVASWWGATGSLAVVPFRGLYLMGTPAAGPLACCVYPVPEPGMPFLGVHFTVAVDGTVKIGPTAMPALWREQYDGLSGFSVGQLQAVLAAHLRLGLADAGVRALAARELGKLSRRVLVRRATPLLDGVQLAHYRAWGRPGIRAQLVDTATQQLVKDFVVRDAEGSVHVLNAVSPGFTCALPFGELVADRVEGL
jgi:L-2-hydroxyglutarate oxidase LhgO